MTADILLGFAKIVVPPLLEHLARLGEGDGSRVFDELTKLYGAVNGDPGKAVHEIRNIKSRAKEIAERRAERDAQMKELEEGKAARSKGKKPSPDGEGEAK